MANSYTVINASAGSGKTYTLVQRLLMICLHFPNRPQVIQNILALTFTNKAANEMKERILSWLADFTSDSYRENQNLISIQEAMKAEGNSLSLEELHLRSKNVLDFILHNYSKLNIGTIDKFNSRLVRSFSYELGLAKNFNLEIQAEPFLQEAVDQMLDKIGETKVISDAFIDYVSYNLDNNDRVNLNTTLFKTAKEFVQDIHYDHLKSNENFDWEAYEQTKTAFRTEIYDLKKDSENIAKNALKLASEKGLQISDFAGGAHSGIMTFFTSFLKNGEPKLFESIEDEEKKVQYYMKGASKTGLKKENEIFEILDFVLASRKAIIQNHVAMVKKEQILAALLPLKVNKDIQTELSNIEEENDVVLLSKFNILINENLSEEPTAFIYEKVGSQFQHYFFDEFQDTSRLQWKNIIPLRDHSVSMDQTSFTLVGDPKQSIYRFRGGDSQLMLDIINKEESTPKEPNVINLDKNWRSAQNIVTFNNQLYQYLSTFTNGAHQMLFGKSAIQQAVSEKKGRVKINLIENGVKESFYADTAERMQKDIQECLDLGFRFSDITILCRTKKDILHYSQKLSALKVHYQEEEMHIKTISEDGLTLELSKTLNAVIQFLNWENNPKNLQYVTLMMYYLQDLGRIQMLDFSSEMMKILALKEPKLIREYLHEQYGIQLEQTKFLKLNLYNFIEYYVYEFSLGGKETDFLLNFLEVLYGFSQNTGASIKDFIKFWNEEASKKNILASENIDAVQLMTVHKAKGLEFPIVFYPVFQENKDDSFSEWFSLEENENLKSVNLGSFKKGLEVYDEEISKFNRENTYKNFIDRLCIQYVATTRPVEQLYLYLQKPKIDSKTALEKNSTLELYDFVQLQNPTKLDEFDYFENENKDQLRKKSETKTINYTTESVLHFGHIETSENPIRIAAPSRSYQERKESVRMGIFLHEILSKIKTKKDVHPVLQHYLINGLITSSECKELSQILQKILSDNENYFREGLTVINEQDIMISKENFTEIYRPDRLVKIEDQWHIIDFKTGTKKKNHVTQVENYKNILEGLGYKVGGYELIYL